MYEKYENFQHIWSVKLGLVDKEGKEEEEVEEEEEEEEDLNCPMKLNIIYTICTTCVLDSCSWIVLGKYGGIE